MSLVHLNKFANSRFFTVTKKTGEFFLYREHFFFLEFLEFKNKFNLINNLRVSSNLIK